MSLDEHAYAVTITWTGNLGSGTSGYRDYSRDHDVQLPGLPVLAGSSDPTFRGDASRYNPEQLLLTALSQCHLLSYLHVATTHKVVVTAYEDTATGLMRLNKDHSGQFESVTLKPRVTITDPAQTELATRLHHDANAVCFIARSVNFPVLHEPEIVVAPGKSD